MRMGKAAIACHFRARRPAQATKSAAVRHGCVNRCGGHRKHAYSCNIPSCVHALNDLVPICGIRNADNTMIHYPYSMSVTLFYVNGKKWAGKLAARGKKSGTCTKHHPRFHSTTRVSSTPVSTLGAIPLQAPPTFRSNFGRCFLINAGCRHTACRIQCRHRPAR